MLGLMRTPLLRTEGTCNYNAEGPIWERRENLFFFYHSFRKRVVGTSFSRHAALFRQGRQVVGVRCGHVSEICKWTPSDPSNLKF